MTVSPAARRKVKIALTGLAVVTAVLVLVQRARDLYEASREADEDHIPEDLTL